MPPETPKDPRVGWGQSLRNPNTHHDGHVPLIVLDPKLSAEHGHHGEYSDCVGTDPIRPLGLSGFPAAWLTLKRAADDQVGMYQAAIRGGGGIGARFIPARATTAGMAKRGRGVRSGAGVAAAAGRGRTQREKPETKEEPGVGFLWPWGGAGGWR